MQRCHHLRKVIVENTVGVDDDRGEYLLSRHQACKTAYERCQKGIAQVFCRYGQLAVPQRFQGSYLSSLLLHHPSHGCETDERRDQEKNGRKNIPNGLYPVGILLVLHIRLYVITVEDVPFWNLQII